jgi:hypothetical protein
LHREEKGFQDRPPKENKIMKMSRTAVRSIKAVLVFGMIVWLSTAVHAFQVAPTQGSVVAPFADQWVWTAEHLTLSAALLLAVAVLWRNLTAKDTLLIASTATITQALATSAASNAELRHIIEESVKAKQDMTLAMVALTARIEAMPCTANHR